MDNPTLERRLKAKDKLIAELLEALEKIAHYKNEFQFLTAGDAYDMKEIARRPIHKYTKTIRKAK